MKFDFRPYVPTKEDLERSRSPEAMALLRKRIGVLFSSWRALYEAPFKGITTNGEVIPNLYGVDLLRLHYQHSHKGHRPGE